MSVSNEIVDLPPGIAAWNYWLIVRYYARTFDLVSLLAASDICRSSERPIDCNLRLSLVSRSASSTKYTAVSLIGVATVRISFLASASAALRHPTFIENQVTDTIMIDFSLCNGSKLPSSSKFRRAARCRECLQDVGVMLVGNKRRRFVPQPEHRSGLSIDQIVVRHSATIVCKMQKTRTGLYRQWTASLQIHPSRRRTHVETFEYAADL